MWRNALMVGVLGISLIRCEDRKEKEAQRLYDAAISYSQREDYDRALELLQRVRVEFTETNTSLNAENQIEEIEKLRSMLMSRQQGRMNQRFLRIALSLDNYKRRYRSYPLTVEDLKKLPPEMQPELLDEDGNPIHYRAYSSPGVSAMEPDQYALASFGTDGLPGGRGKAADYFYQNGKDVGQLTLP